MCPDSTGTKQTQPWPSFGPYHTPQEWPITPISQMRTRCLRDARGFSQSHRAGLGTQLGSPLWCLMPPSPLPPAGLQVPNHGLTCSPNKNRGAGGHPGRRVCKLARHGCRQAAGEGTYRAQGVGMEGAGAPLLPAIHLMSHLPDSTAHVVLWSLGTFSTVYLHSPSKALHLVLSLLEGPS